MKYSLNWLRDFLDAPVSADELTHRLPALGFPVESVVKKGPNFSGVVTAEVLAVGPHPNADRLRLCDVTDGQTTYKIVCGAPNVAQGMKVAMAKIGAVLPGITIKPAKIRGIESQGMLCSTKELELGTNGEGILSLPAETPLGQDFAGMQGGADTLFEVEVTPNRPDILSHYGLARELSWALKAPLKRPEPKAAPASSGIAKLPFTIEDFDACPRYVGRRFTGLKVGPSPAWLAQRLEACGLRPINNLVDITNYVLLELGHPLHAFDAKKLQGPEIRIRWAKDGETISALDGKSYTLAKDHLVIADAQRPVALAGVIGGSETSVTETTTEAFLESAYFKPSVIRPTARKLGLRTDSSFRFERGCDPEAALLASRRATELILELCGGQAGEEADVAKLPARPQVEVSLERVASLLGMKLEAADIEPVVQGLGGQVKVAGTVWTVTAPSHRHDIAIEADVAEEVARLVGYDKMPAEPAPASLPLLPDPRAQEWTKVLRERLVGLGFFEAFNYDFLSNKDLSDTGISAEAPRLLNPISADWVVLRPSLLPGLLRNLRHNLHRGAESVRLFEVGKVFGKDDERWMLAGVVGGAETANWAKAPQAPDFAGLKGVVESMLSGLAELRPAPAASGLEPLHPGRSAASAAGADTVLRYGQVHPTVLKAWDLSDAWYFELELDRLPGRPPWGRRFKPFSTFPSSQRDLSVLLPSDVAWSKVEQAVRRAAGTVLADLSLFDLFTGGKIPAGKRSLTMRLTLVSDKKTLSEEDIQAAVQRVVEALKPLGGELRS